MPQQLFMQPNFSTPLPISAQEVSVAAAQNYLAKLDLNYLVEYMTSERYPLPRWAVTEITYCIQQYKNFLLLIKKNKGLFLVPTKHIDEVWHNHILYTKRYFYDCLNIFGHYLHHDPAMPGDDSQTLIANYQKTKQLYFKEFKQPLSLCGHKVTEF